MEKGMYMVLIVAVVAVVSLVILTMNAGNVVTPSFSDADLAGMATGGGKRPVKSGGGSGTTPIDFCRDFAQESKSICLSSCESMYNCDRYMDGFQIELWGNHLTIAQVQNGMSEYSECLEAQTECSVGCLGKYMDDMVKCAEDYNAIHEVNK